mmetsp:Transcript_83051/g.164735  ORF Transcript_83051/g.164735 Transcript_83051/m.164735 type:complete len:159 (+) Transcript_83051:58-534(+)
MARRSLLPCSLCVLAAVALSSRCFLTGVTSRRSGETRAPLSRSRSFFDDALTALGVGPEAGKIQLDINLFADTECTEGKSFVSKAGPVELDKCVYSEEDRMSVFYTCENGRLNSFVYNLNEGCDKSPYLETKRIENGKCSLVPPFGSGIWKWSNGCGA